jgi:arylsulfatase A-like enzyme
MQVVRNRIVTVAAVASLVAVTALIAYRSIERSETVGFTEQACGLPRAWLERIQRGYYEPRSGQISLLPQTPAYMASGGDGWSHSGPWPYLQDVPLVFYGPGVIDAGVEVTRPVTVADVAPTIATLLRGTVTDGDGRSLPEVAVLENVVTRPKLKLIVTIVWDGGGWNTLDQWADPWPNLRRMMNEGVSFTSATDGSSPSVTPAVHSTLGTGTFPSTHGITGVPVRDEQGVVVDSFLNGESARFLLSRTIAERWDEQTGNEALVAMIGYEPWHLGMIGQGAEAPGGDKDHAAWLTKQTEWVTNPDHYSMPSAVRPAAGPDADIDAVDASDGEADGQWRRVPLDDPTRREETPAFVAHHGRVLEDLIANDGYGADGVTDLIFTNFKQIDRIGHYYNMDSEEVRDNVAASDVVLGELLAYLETEVGHGRYAVVLTADHGQQPDEAAVDGYGIDPNEVELDIDARFGGRIARAVWPTEVFLLEDEMTRLGVTVEDVAGFLADYRLRDNATSPAQADGAGRFEPADRLFEMAIPAAMLPGLDCSAR